MIKYGNSLLISLFVHAIFLLAFFFLYKNYFETKKNEENVLCVKLCNIAKNSKAEEVKETKNINTPKQNSPKEQEAPKKAVVEEKIPEKNMQTIDEALDIKPSYVEPTKDEVIPPEPPREPIVREKPIATQECAQGSVAEQNIKEPLLAKEVFGDDYLEINMQKITQLLEENLYYPISARKRNITGLVKVSFTLGVDAKVDNIKVVESNSDILSRAAIKTIEALSTKFPKPHKELTLSVPINYSLN